NILGAIKQNPQRLEGLAKQARDDIARHEKTMNEVWPREKEYRDTLAKLDALTTELQGPKHPDVAEAEAETRAAAEEGLFTDEVKAQARKVAESVRELPFPDNTVGFADVTKVEGPAKHAMKKHAVFGLPLNPMAKLEQLKGSSFLVSYGTMASRRNEV